MRYLFSALLIIVTLSLAHAAIPATFNHGVASGDPLPTGIVLWTRVTPRLLYTGYTPLHKWPFFNVTWTIFSDAGATTPVQSGSFNATRDHDYTVKVFADGLKPTSEYWYNFMLVNGSETSPTGHFRLPPEAGQPLESLKYFFFSCSNWPTGFFNAYDQASKYDLDFWLHLGDYIYEYGSSDGSKDVRWERAPLGLQPSTDIQSVDDYRARHATYRQDPGLQALSASAALIAIWDDHEFMNNVWSEGAQNQYPGEVEYWQRRANALRAYTEWIPIRWNFTVTPRINEPANYAINRTFQFGDLATFFMLEDRVTARTNAGQNTNEFDPTEITDPDVAAEPIVGELPPSQWNDTVDQAMLQLQLQYNQKRTNKSDAMLGPAQIAWIQDETARSVEAGTVWQLYAEGTVMQDWFSPDFEGVLLGQGGPSDGVRQYWQDSYNNLTSAPAANGANSTITSYSTAASNIGTYGKPKNITDSIRSDARVAVALGKYKINFDFDSWQGYLWDRYYFLGNISKATNPTIYSGDSHDFWTGYLTYVSPDNYVRNGSDVPTTPVAAIEFDGGSVTSDGSNSETNWPLDFVNAAWLEANPNMVHVEVRYKGGVYVQLTPTNQHVEHIYVDTIASQNYRGFCGVAFDAPARNSTNEDQIINPGQCGPVPAGAPYSKPGQAILPNQIAVKGIPVKPNAILAGTAMPTDAFLVGSS